MKTTWTYFPSSSRLLLQVIIAAMLACAIFHIPTVSAQKKEPERPGDILSQGAHTVKHTLEGLLGKELTEQITSTLSSLFWIFCSAISTGLITLSGLIQQLLTVLGVGGDHLTRFLELSPSQVQYILVWALAALIGYWILSFVLGLVFSFVSRTLWLIKVSIFLLAFFYILMLVPDTNLRVQLLLGLLGIYALVGRLGSSGPRYDAHVENKLWSLERQVEKLQQNQRRAEKLSKNYDK
ncbi:transmembrane protein 109 [Microcaecilia unicolor]|uniref:Transmembrane protein 109-like n=1 Tax=Microcaecilia unicolor TaxID=1415580 RepID=A0A6P7ZFC7_9AMPH|nr:transmembrane protein 109-like [Microcaecilia unicolor]XP_030046181.1 transmembrane protein 109-like [Microcaecilia unicolor]XP_030078047.1 transmembrane protein 109-like [Microcaecilia unicolor]XP_030078056.1 transmembrane protein 109-like [Microcaecilia unicolor]